MKEREEEERKEREKCKCPVELPQECGYPRAHKKSDADRRNRMGVEKLKKLDVASQKRNQAALLLSVEFCRAERAEFFKDKGADSGKERESDKVIAILLGIMKHSPKDSRENKEFDRNRREKRKNPENWNRNRREKARRAQDDGKSHHREKGQNQAGKP